MKLGIITALHGRHELTKLWSEHTAALAIPVFAAITEGDAVNVATAERYGFAFREMPNDPVGDKFQIALDMAMDAGCDAIMVLGSDDFISAEWVALCIAKMQAGIPYIVPDRLAIHAPGGGTYMLMTDGRSHGRFGAGRCIARSVIEQVGALWVEGRNKGLDSESHARITATGIFCEAVHAKLIPLVDVKTATNIWPWRVWRGGGHKCSENDALHMLSPSIQQRVSLLR